MNVIMESTGRTRTKRSRVNFTIPQIQVLETIFFQTQYPDVTVVEALAQRLDLPVEKICTWFQNRRSKFRRESKRGHIEMMRKQMFQDDKVTSYSNSHKSVIKSVSESDKKKDCVRQEPTQPQPTRYNPYELKSQSTRYSPYSKPSSNQSHSATTPCNSRWMNQQQYWQQTAAYQPSYNMSGSNQVNQGGYNNASHLPYNLTPQQMASLYYNPALPGYLGIPAQSTGFSTMSSAVSSSHDPGYTTTSTGEHPVYTSRLPDLLGCTTAMSTSPTGGALSPVSGSSSNNESCSGPPCGQHGLSGSPCDQHELSASPTVQHGLSGSPSGQHGLSGSPSDQHGLSGSPCGHHELSGSPCGQHGLSASPTVQHGLSGSPSGQHGLSASPSGQHGLSGLPCGQHGLSASPTVQHRLSGSPSGQHGLSASPSGQHGLSGSPSGQHGLSGSPSGQHGLSASPTVQHGLSRSPSGQHGLSGSPSGQHGLSGSPCGQHELSETPSSQYGLSGSPTGQHGLSGSPTGQHGLSGSPSCQHGLSRSSSGHIPYTGSPSAHVELSALDYNSRCLYSDPPFTFMYNGCSDNMAA